MLGWNEIVQQYITKYSDLTQKITQPLRDHFGITYFTYHRIDSNGHYTVLVDLPQWAEHYVSKKFFLNDPYLRNIDVYKHGVCKVDTQGSDEYRDRIMRSGAAAFDMDIGMMFIQPSFNAVEFFGCGANIASSKIEQLYYEEHGLLKAFIAYFKEKMHLVLQKMQEEQISLPLLKGNDFFINEQVSLSTNTSTRREFLNDLGMNKIVQQVDLLTARERACLSYLLEGKTAKETATKLMLSPRTIESYFENIKNKLSCFSKKEVIETATNFQYLGLL